MVLVIIYVEYQLQFYMGVLRLFSLLFQWRSCISRAGFSFPRDKIVSCTRGGFLSIFIVGGTFVSFCFVTLVGVLAAILHIFVMVSFSRRYAPATDLLVVLCCFVLRRVRLTLKAVGCYGGRLRRVYFTIWNMCIHCAYSQG